MWKAFNPFIFSLNQQNTGAAFLPFKFLQSWNDVDL